MLGAGLAIAVAPTTAASAAPLCLTNDVVTTVTIVLPTAKLKKAKVKPLVGQVVGAGAAMPLSGLSIVSADGMSLVIAVEAPRVSQLAEQIRLGNVEPLERHERRRLTLFFSDIKGFTEAAERLEPEDLSNVLNLYLSEMTAIAERHGATIDKFVGDGMMIFFGAPLPAEEHDQAVRAVRMALEMQRRIGDLDPMWRKAGLVSSLEVRMGINTGQASVGNFGSKGRVDYTAIGRQVNLAARLQAACTPGRILISRATWLLVQDAIDAESIGAIEVKGFQRPVEVYEVVGEKREAAALS